MKVGFITMHRVLNFGSILQAYALQQSLNRLGVANEIIDYVFPFTKQYSIFVRLSLGIRKLVYQIRTATVFHKKKQRYFQEFEQHFLKLSKEKYNDISIRTCPPQYDIYMTGSDQVWNPLWMKNHTSFLLSFVDKDKPKISYASSFTVNEIPIEHRALYQRYLGEYKAISVRELSGVKIIKQLTNLHAKVVCDPTLLIDKDDYIKISRKPKLKIETPFILVYLLNYMFDPFPAVNEIVRFVGEQLKLPVVYIGGKFSVYDSRCLSIENLGPQEFIWLFHHADFVISSSFHGCAFATIFEKPSLAIINNEKGKDSRIPSLMQHVGNEKSLTMYNSKLDYSAEYLHQLKPDHLKFEHYKSASLEELERMVMGCYSNTKSGQEY